ncbi:MAG: ribulose-phosphate 3-epimerase [Acidobacteriota bacterium]
MIIPSILSANFAFIGDSIKRIENGGIEAIHVDIMDGHFVPNLTFGPELIRSIKKLTSVSLDVHLMIDNPHSMLKFFIDYGSDWLSIHVESSPHLNKIINNIKKNNRKAGVALNPATSLSSIDEIIEEVDFVLLMSVNPGFEAQNFINSTLKKITKLKEIVLKKNLKVEIEVDGGIGIDNIEKIIDAGADLLVIGSSIFKSADPLESYIKFKEIEEKKRKLNLR